MKREKLTASEARQKAKEAEDAMFDQFTELMIERIEKVSQDWRQPWLNVTSNGAPRNLDGRFYNGCNMLMLMLWCEKQGYKFPLFCTFKRIQKMNEGEEERARRVCVLKGEKSFPVELTLFIVVSKDTHEVIDYDVYKKMTEEEQARYNVLPRLKVFRVFNIAQTNMEEARPDLWEKYTKTKERAEEERKQSRKFVFAPLQRTIECNTWHCPVLPKHQDQAYYSISKNEIVVPELRQFKDGEAFVSTCMHEMSHSTGAEPLLNRFDDKKGWGTTEFYYDKEELIAELTAAVTCARYGITKHIKEESASYLKSWLDHMKEQPGYIKNVLTEVRKAHSMLVCHFDAMRKAIEGKKKESNTKTA